MAFFLLRTYLGNLYFLLAGHPFFATDDNNAQYNNIQPINIEIIMFLESDYDAIKPNSKSSN